MKSQRTSVVVGTRERREVQGPEPGLTNREAAPSLVVIPLVQCLQTVTEKGLCSTMKGALLWPTLQKYLETSFRKPSTQEIRVGNSAIF